MSDRTMSWIFAIPAFLSLAALTSCVSSEAATPVEAPAETAAETPDVTAVEQTSPAPLPSLPQVGPAQNTRFSFTGEMTQGGFIRGMAPDGTVQASLGENKLELAEDGSFFAAFDRDSDGSGALTATLNNGQVVREELIITPREWQIQRVNIARRPGGSSAAFRARRQPELDAIWDARQMKTGATGWTQQFIWPVKGRISGLFGRQRIYRGEPGGYHSGIDIAPGNGVPFVAPADGVVVLARTGFSLEGGLIIVDHGGGLNSAFLHASQIVVEEGQTVRQGQHIGNVGSTGRATGPHLHWSLKWHLARLDPLLFVGPMN